MKYLFLYQKLFHAIAQWHQRRRSIIDLNSMPDYLLADIGISRHQISDVVHNLQAKSPSEDLAHSGKKPVWPAGKQATAVSAV